MKKLFYKIKYLIYCPTCRRKEYHSGGISLKMQFPFLFRKFKCDHCGQTQYFAIRGGRK